MPPKAKLHKSTSKLRSLPKCDISEDAPELQLSPEAAQQFELELCWCIQQIQTALKSGKLSAKQVQDHTKALNVLMSNSTSLVRKRQVMRLSFGDYRAKMAEQEKKLKTSATKIKISQANPSKKSMFLKKSGFSTSDNSFRFNFSNPEQVTATSEDKCVDTESANRTFQFEPSNNDFKFNFSSREQSIASELGNININSGTELTA